MHSSGGSGPFLRLSFLGVTAWCWLILGLYFWPAGTLLDRFEWRTVDWRFHVRGEQKPDTTDHRIIIVAVDEDSIATEGRWPWPRRTFANLVDKLNRAQARRIVFDVFFTERDESRDGPTSDAALVAATQRGGNVFHAGFIYQPSRTSGASVPAAVQERAWDAVHVRRAGGLASVAGLIEPAGVMLPLVPLATAARGFGVANVLDSGDGVYRHLVPLIRYEGKLYPSVALALAADWLQVPPDQVKVTPGREINLGGLRRLPLDMHGRFLIDFLGGDRTFDYVSVAQVLARSDAENRKAFRDAIVLIGVTAPGIYDLRACPFDTVYNGVEAEASAIDAILSGRFIRQPSPLVTGLLILAFIPLYGLLLPRLRTAAMTPLALTAVAAYPWLGVMLFTRYRMLLDIVNPTLAMLGSLVVILVLRLLVEERRRHQVQTVLRYFVPPELVGRLVEEEALTTMRGERRDISVLFADLRNFTATAEALAPEDTVTFLNRYFGLMHEVIWEHEGTLDKYMGDEIMVFYNAPVAQADHARRAVMTAIDMQRRIMANQAEWEYLQVPGLAAGIGIATGQAVVGYVGSAVGSANARMQYTVIGQTVNLASRLQTLCKALGCRILISDDAYRAVADIVAAQDLGELPITGFAHPIRVWHVLDYRDANLRGNWEPGGTPITVPSAAQTPPDAV
jgi:adenylate cyclase